MKRLLTLALAGAAAALTPALCAAQGLPARISLIVPYPAGGSVDGVARIIAQRLGEKTGKNVIVENRAGGAGGTIGAAVVAKAPTDGATLLLTASIHVITPLLQQNIPYDVVKDFTPISLVASGPLVVSTAPKVPAKTLKEFFDLVRKEPNKYTFATSSFGSAGHLALEQLKRDAGLDTLVVAYKGAGPALNDLMGGTVQLMADPMLSSLPLAQAGNIKALAITSLKRVAAAPEIPTVAESGVPGFEFSSWYGLWGPKDMPAALVTLLHDETVAVVREPETRKRLETLGFEPIGSTPQVFAKYIVDEMTKYEKIIKDGNIKAN